MGSLDTPAQLPQQTQFSTKRKKLSTKRKTQITTKRKSQFSTKRKSQFSRKRKMGSKTFPVFLTLLLASPALSLFFGPPSKGCRSDRDCPGFRRTTCEGRGPNFLFIFPTCGRQRTYTVPGKCDVVPDTLCNIGNFLGGRNQCNYGSRCADCLASQDCSYDENCRSGRCMRRPRNTRTG